MACLADGLYGFKGSAIELVGRFTYSLKEFLQIVGGGFAVLYGGRLAQNELYLMASISTGIDTRAAKIVSVSKH